MSGARLSTLASLQGAIDRLESGVAETVRRTPLGHAEADAVLQGGLARGALHEVFGEGRQSGRRHRLCRRRWRDGSPTKRFLLWVRTDFSARENGDLAMAGFAELGLDPRRIVWCARPTPRARCAPSADALACNALGAVVTELWGETRAFDLVASRKLTLAAMQSGVTALMLRIAAAPQASTAETRWVVRAAHSPPLEIGAPRCSKPRSSAIVTARPAAGSWNGIVMRAASVNRRRILGLWLPRLPTDRIERRSPPSNGSPAEGARPPRVVAAKRDNALVVIACDARATQGGLLPGMPLATARAMHPALDIVDHDPARRRSAAGGDRRLVRPLHAAGGARWR